MVADCAACRRAGRRRVEVAIGGAAECVVDCSSCEMQRVVLRRTLCGALCRESAVNAVRDRSARDRERIVLHGVALIGASAPDKRVRVVGIGIGSLRIVAETVACRCDFRIGIILIDGQLIVAVRSPKLFRMVVRCAEIELVVAAGMHQRPCRFIGARSAARAVFDLELRPVERRRRYRRGSTVAVVQRQHGVSAGLDRIQRKGDDVELLHRLCRRFAADIELVVRRGILISARDHAADCDACPLDVDGVVRGDAGTVGFAAVDVARDLSAAQVYRVVRRISRRRLRIAAVDIPDRPRRTDSALNIDCVVGRVCRRRRRIRHCAVDVVQIAVRQSLYGHFIVRGRIAAFRIAAVEIPVRRARRRVVKYNVRIPDLVIDSIDIRCRTRTVCSRSIGIDTALIFPVGSKRSPIAAGIVRDLQPVCLPGKQRKFKMSGSRRKELHADLRPVKFCLVRAVVRERQHRIARCHHPVEREIDLIEICYIARLVARRTDVQRIPVGTCCVAAAVDRSGGTDIICVGLCKGMFTVADVDRILCR